MCTPCSYEDVLGFKDTYSVIFETKKTLILVANLNEDQKISSI